MLQKKALVSAVLLCLTLVFCFSRHLSQENLAKADASGNAVSCFSHNCVSLTSRAMTSPEQYFGPSLLFGLFLAASLSFIFRTPPLDLFQRFRRERVPFKIAYPLYRMYAVFLL